MSNLPRLLGYLDASIAARDDLGVGLAAIAALGHDAALVARLPGGSDDAIATLAARCIANARPPGAGVLVSGRVDIALATGANGVVARRDDLPIGELRRLAEGHPGFTIFAAVHTLAEANAAAEAGADALIVGTIWATASHPDRPGSGLGLLEACAKIGPPCFAIGGVTVARAREAGEAGAWGIAAISALWEARRRYQRALELVAAVRGEG